MGSLSKMFNLKSIGKFLLWTIPITVGVAFGSEIVTHIWAHFGSGQGVIDALKVPVLEAFNSLGIDGAMGSFETWIRDTFNTSATDQVIASADQYQDATRELINNMAPAPETVTPQVTPESLPQVDNSSIEILGY